MKRKEHEVLGELKDGKAKKRSRPSSSSSWVCQACTFSHEGPIAGLNECTMCGKAAPAPAPPAKQLAPNFGHVQMSSASASVAFDGGGSSSASRALMKALSSIQRSRELSKMRVEVPGDNLHVWRVSMPSASFIDDSLQMFQGLEKFHFHTGHVTIGGSICTEVLTSTGWKSNITMEALLLYLHSTLIDGGGRIVHSPAPHHPRPEMDYSDSEARSAFARVARAHGWRVPRR